MPRKKSSTVKSTTRVRNTAIPKTTKVEGKQEITHEMISHRAYEIALAGNGGGQLDHWLQAERELKGI